MRPVRVADQGKCNQMIDEESIRLLQQKFADVLNHTADDIAEPIDPLTYISPEGDTCLHLAAIRGDEEAVKLLLDAGLDVDAKGDMGNTALHYALTRKHLPVAVLLIERGASQDIENEFGRMPKEMT